MTVAAHPSAPPALTADRDELWRAVVAAASNALPEGGTVQERQATAWRIAFEAVARLQAARERRWAGAPGDPCWTCGGQLAEHTGPLLSCPGPTSALSIASTVTPTAKLDALIAAATATGARNASVLIYTTSTRTEHIVTLDLGESTREEFVALVAEYGGPTPIDRIGDSHRWLLSRFDVPGTTITLNLQGSWQRRAEHDTAATATP